MADFKTNIESEMKAGLENTAALGATALRPGPTNMTSTYVERMHAYYMALVEKEIEAQLKK